MGQSVHIIDPYGRIIYCKAACNGYEKHLEQIRYCSWNFIKNRGDALRSRRRDLSYNNLSGSIPESLAKTFNFVGNPLICATASEQDCHGTAVAVPMSMSYNVNMSQSTPLARKPRDHSKGEGETFLKGLLMNGWLLKLAFGSSLVEESIARWSFHTMLYSLNEELQVSAYDFWCCILQSGDEANQPLVRLGWYPSYSAVKDALLNYGYLYDTTNNCSSTSEASPAD